MKSISIVLLMMASLVMTSRAVGWKEMEPAELRMWMMERTRNLSWPGAVLDLLGQADEQKGGSVAEGAQIVWRYLLEEGRELEITFGEGVKPRSQVMYEYGVWNVAADGTRTKVWVSAMGRLMLTMDRKMEADKKKREKPAFKGDLPEHLYEMKEGGAAG